MDKTYDNCEIIPSISPLLKTNTKNNMPYVGWIHTVENSEVVYFQFGNDKNAFENENYQKLLFQSINYLAKNKNRKE